MSFLRKSLQAAIEAAMKAKQELDAADSKLTLMNGEPVLGENPAKLSRLKSVAAKRKEEEEYMRESLEGKEAHLSRALGENEDFILFMYKSFSSVMADCLPEKSDTTMFQSLLSSDDTESMAVDAEGGSTMEVDQEKEGNEGISLSSGAKRKSVYSLGETEQWCLTTLGYVKALSRQYASGVNLWASCGAFHVCILLHLHFLIVSHMIWPHIEIVDAEV